MSKFYFGIVGKGGNAETLKRAIVELPEYLRGKYIEKAKDKTSLRGQFSKLMKPSDSEMDWTVRIKGVEPNQDDFRTLLTHLQEHQVDLSTIKCSGDVDLVKAFNDLSLTIRQSSHSQLKEPRVDLPNSVKDSPLNARQSSPESVVEHLSKEASSQQPETLSFKDKLKKINAHYSGNAPVVPKADFAVVKKSSPEPT